MMNILTIGGSRNIGYFASLRFLEAGHTVTFLLRSTAVFDGDSKIQEYITSGKAYLVKGDALILEDVKRAWDASKSQSADWTVDLCLFTLGGTPKFGGLKGFVISPPNLVTNSLLNVLLSLPSPSTKLITISSTGLTRTSHESLPLPLKPVYGWLLDSPHKDKVGAERVLHHLAGWSWDTQRDGEPVAEVLSPDWFKTEGLPAPGTLKHILVIRPALLTDGECIADKERKKGKDGKEKAPYRVSENEIGGWTVSRKDVAHFIADAALNRWEEVEGKILSIAY